MECPKRDSVCRRLRQALEQILGADSLVGAQCFLDLAGWKSYQLHGAFQGGEGQEHQSRHL